MQPKRIIAAVAASVPLLPFLLVTPAYVQAFNDSYVTDSIGFVLAPLGLELGCFFLFFAASMFMGRKLTKGKSLGLLIGTTGLYTAYAAMALSTALPKDSIPRNTKIAVIMVLAYTLVNLIITVWHSLQNTDRIVYYFGMRYFLPLCLTMAVGAIDLHLLSGLSLVLNPVMIYLITRNFAHAATPPGVLA